MLSPSILQGSTSVRKWHFQIKFSYIPVRVNSWWWNHVCLILYNWQIQILPRKLISQISVLWLANNGSKECEIKISQQHSWITFKIWVSHRSRLFKIWVSHWSRLCDYIMSLTDSLIVAKLRELHFSLPIRDAVLCAKYKLEFFVSEYVSEPGNM